MCVCVCVCVCGGGGGGGGGTKCLVEGGFKVPIIFNLEHFVFVIWLIGAFDLPLP